MGYDTILFDMDGTLLDTLDDLLASTNAALAALGFPPRTREELRAFVGNGARNQLRRALPADCGDAVLNDALARYRAHYARHCADHTRPYDGVTAALQRLHAAGKRLAVVSNKPDEMVRLLAEKHFGALLPVALGETAARRRKPAPDMVFAALDALGAPRTGAVYVGDSEVDVQTAQNAGLPLIAVSWGFRTRAALAAAGARCIVDTPEKLAALCMG